MPMLFIETKPKLIPLSIKPQNETLQNKNLLASAKSIPFPYSSPLVLKLDLQQELHLNLSNKTTSHQIPVHTKNVLSLEKHNHVNTPRALPWHIQSAAFAYI